MSEEADVLNLMASPYEERRLILVSNEAVLKAAEEERQKRSAAKKPEGFDWNSVAAAALGFAVRGGLWEFALSKVVVDIGVAAYRNLNKARESGAPVRAISFKEAAQLKFPPGHPREGVVYVCHPVQPHTYYTMADFHRVVFEHKFAEAMLLLMSLGAKTMRVEHVTGWSTEFSGSLDTPSPVKSVNVGLGVQGDAHKDKKLLFTASLNGSHVPLLPDGMAWYPHEPTWSSVSRGRIDFGLSEFSLSVRYNDNYGHRLQA